MATTSAEVLFKPLKIGQLELPNRIVMAPLTRTRAANPGRVPNELMVTYYVQRASAGLILTEATSVTPMGVGYANTPGIWTDEQTEGWKAVTRAVHEAGGHIFMQLWHVGRISDPQFLPGNALPVAPSPIAATGHVSLVRPLKPYVTPRALEDSEIPQIVEDYRRGAANARRAGFDGVEIHAANGYLIDQFLQDHSNKRQGPYGGSIENRARLLMEVVDACASAWEGAEHVGVHLAPRCDLQDMGDSDPRALFTYVVKQLAQRKVAFVFAREHEAADSLGPELRKAFGGVWIANESFTRESAIKIVEDGTVDAVAFGKDFIANPDLPARLRKGTELNKCFDMHTFYGSDAHGYTDYPTL